MANMHSLNSNVKFPDMEHYEHSCFFKRENSRNGERNHAVVSNVFSSCKKYSKKHPAEKAKLHYGERSSHRPDLDKFYQEFKGTKL